jgi:hypothetical protein
MTKIALGGLGDFLQMASSAIKEGSVDIFTHSGEAGRIFFEGLRVPINTIENFWTVNELSGLNINYSNLLDRDPFDLEGCYKALELSKENKIYDLAIHPFGSYYSMHNDLSLNRNVGKTFSSDILQHIVDKFKDKEIILLGTPQECSVFAELIKRNPNIAVKNTSIWDAIAITCQAINFIGADSFLKTARTIYVKEKSSTTILVERKIDQFRDKYFIEPYVDRANFIYYNSFDELNIIL